MAGVSDTSAPSAPSAPSALSARHGRPQGPPLRVPAHATTPPLRMPDPTPDTARAALPLVGGMKRYDVDGADALIEQAGPVVPVLAALMRRAKATGVPVIYANDQFGRWGDDFRA